MRARSLRSAGWVVGGRGSASVIRLASNLVLTRLLFPEAFGLMAIVHVFIAGLNLFSDVGIRPSIVRSSRGDDPVFLQTAWTLQVFRGIFLAGLCVATSGVVARVYGEPELAILLPAVATTVLLRGLQSTAVHLSHRKLQMGRIERLEIVGSVSGSALTIAWALVSPTTWALVAGNIATALITVSLGHLLLESPSHRLRLDRESLVELFGFGKWVFLTTALTFLSIQGDRLIMPKIFGVSSFAFYGIAAMLATVPLDLFKRLANSILFPAYSELLRKGDVEGLGKAIRQAQLSLAPFFAIPIVLLLGGEAIVRWLYDPRYESVGVILVLMAVTAYIDMVRASQSGLLLAAGDSRGQMFVNLVRILVGLPLAVALAAPLGVPGFCLGTTVGSALALVVQRAQVARQVPGLDSAADRLLLSALLVGVGVKAALLAA